MSGKLISGIALIVWQVAAYLLQVTDQVATVIAWWPDPGWYSAALAFLLRPTTFTVISSLGIGIMLVVWTWLEYRARD